MIKQISTIALATVALVALTACSGEKKATEVKTYKYTTTEVYEKSCSKCHGLNGEGNFEKKTPALNDRTAGEMAQDLYDIKNTTTINRHSTDHDVMEHNMEKLVDQGFDYDINSMAEYMSKLSRNK